MTSAAHQYDGLHRLVDQLKPAQADAVRAVVLQLVTTPEVESTQPRRRLSFAGSLSAEPDFAERSEEILDDLTRRNAG
ncbi:hypothetical protein [Fodinicola feengrottensis]|uniref:hypothetical protein n=1 Tax=Fodinicola feengrottensis TaxID=435914 RepID=UPI0031DB797C